MSDRSLSRGRSPTPARTPPGANGRSRSRSDSRSPRRSPSPALERTNGARRTRSRSPSRARTRSRSRERSYRARSHSRSPLPSRSRSPPGARSSKIVIEKLTKNVQKDHLREIFGSYGDIAELEMPMNKQFMTNKGLAYVVYSSPDGAESAIAHMHEAQLDGAMINIGLASLVVSAVGRSEDHQGEHQIVRSDVVRLCAHHRPSETAGRAAGVRREGTGGPAVVGEEEGIGTDTTTEGTTDPEATPRAAAGVHRLGDGGAQATAADLRRRGGWITVPGAGAAEGGAQATTVMRAEVGAGLGGEET